MSSRRPNILVITTDQHRADCFSFARSDIRTPHIDRLAARGTRFDRCYCAGPLCQPARASILTGLLPYSHGVRDNGVDLPQDMVGHSFARRAGEAGYRTKFMGKAHFATQHTFAPTGSPECRANTAEFDGWDGPYMGFDKVELFVDGPVKWPSWEPPHGLHYTKWLFADGFGKEKDRLYHQGPRPESGAQQTHLSALPLAWHTSSWLGDRATRFLEDQPADEPFLLWVSFPDPHHPFDAPEPYGTMYRPEDVDLPKHRDLDLSRRPWWHEASMTATPKTNEEFRAIREQMSRQKAMTDRQMRDITANYFGMISLVDHNVGRILGALHAAGLADDTVVILTSDHGEFLGDHGLLFKGPMLYDSLIRVGMICAGPGIAPGKVVKEVVSTVDLAPTIAELCGADGDGYDGASLCPAFAGDLGAGAAGRGHHHIEWDLDASRCGIDLDLRTVVTKRYRYTLETGSGAGELYDLERDPYEMDNLFGDPAVRDDQAALEAIRLARPATQRQGRLPIVGMA